MSKLVKMIKNISFERRAFLFILSLLILCIIAIFIILLTHVNKLNHIKAKLNNYLAIFHNNNNNLSDFIQFNINDTNSADYYLNNQTLSLTVSFGNRSLYYSNISSSDLSTIVLETKKRECGIRSIIDSDSNRQRRKRIINSKNAKENYGWVVSIRFIYKNKKLSPHFCAGSLISTNYVITSANCIFQYKFDQSKIFFFLLKFNSNFDFIIFYL
jgi:hypothetical protein